MMNVFSCLLHRANVNVWASFLKFLNREDQFIVHQVTAGLSDDQHSPSPCLSLDVQYSNFACGSCSFDYKLQVFFRKSGAVNPTNIMGHEIVVLKVPLREKSYLF